MRPGDILEALRAYRVKHDRIAAVIGRDRTVVTKMLAGKRSIKVNELEPLTRLVEAVLREHGGIPPQEPLAPSVLRQPTRDLVGLPVRDAIQAGAWLEIMLVSEAEHRDPDIYPASPDPRYPRAAQWIRAVRGDSMNALTKAGQPAGILEGDYVHVVDAYAIGYRPSGGDIVEVTQTRFHGREIQITLKQIEVTPNGRVLLCPRSNNPRWQAPIDYIPAENDSDHTEVRVSGKVLQVLRPF